MALGAGRERMEDAVDPAVGFSGIRAVGERVAAGEALLVVHAATGEQAAAAEAAVRRAFTVVSELPPPRPPLVRERITGSTYETP